MKRSLLFLSLVSVNALAQQSVSPGLLDWYHQLTQLRSTPVSSVRQMKRTMVAFIGDSHPEGVINRLSTDTLTDNYGWRATNLLRRDLRLSNYPAVLAGTIQMGGSSYIPSVDSANTPILGPGGWSGGEQFGVWTDHRWNNGNTHGLAIKYAQTSQPGAWRRFYKWPGGFSTPSRGFNDPPTAYSFVYQKRPGNGIIEFSLTDWSGNVVYNAIEIDTNSTEIGYGYTTIPIPTNQGFWVRVRNKSVLPAPIQWEGAWIYSNDEEAGIQIGNFSCGGSMAESYTSDAHIDALMRSNPDAIVIWWGHNDVITGARTVAQWESSTRTIIEKILHRKPKVSILLMHGFHFGPSQKERWEQVLTAVKQMANDYHIAYLSLHEIAGGQNAEEWAVPRGYKAPWFAHLSREGQVWLAGLWKSVLNKSLTLIDNN